MATDTRAGNMNQAFQTEIKWPGSRFWLPRHWYPVLEFCSWSISRNAGIPAGEIWYVWFGSINTFTNTWGMGSSDYLSKVPWNPTILHCANALLFRWPVSSYYYMGLPLFSLISCGQPVLVGKPKGRKRQMNNILKKNCSYWFCVNIIIFYRYSP